MLASKVMFVFKRSEHVLIDTAISINKKEMEPNQKFVAEKANEKAHQLVCELDGSEMFIVSAALRYQSLKYFRQGLTNMGIDALRLSGQVTVALVRFNRDWSIKLGKIKNFKGGKNEIYWNCKKN